MLSLHPLKSSFEAVSFVGIGLLAQLGSLVFQGVLLMNPAPASRHSLISRKHIPTLTMPLTPTKTTAMPIQSARGMSIVGKPFIIFTIIVVITVYYGIKLFCNKGCPPPGRPSRQPSDQSLPGDSSGSGPLTPPPDAGAGSDSIPPPKKRGWSWFWISCVLSTLFSLVWTWYYWPEILKVTILWTILSLSSTLLFLIGPITSSIVTMRRKVRKPFIRTRKHLLKYFSHWNTRHPRTTGACIDILVVIWFGLCLLAPLVACILAFYGVHMFVPEFRQLVVGCRTSIYSYCIAWFVNQLTWQYMACIVGPTVLVVLFKLRSPHLEEHLDTLSDVISELIEKNQTVEQRLQALQPRILHLSESPRSDHVGINSEDVNTSPNDGAIKGLLDHGQQNQVQQQTEDLLDTPNYKQLEGPALQTRIDYANFECNLQIESTEKGVLVEVDETKRT